MTGLAYSGSERLLIGNSKDKKSFGMHFLIALGICLVLFILSNIGIAVRNKKRYGGGEEDKPREYANYEGADCKMVFISRTRAPSCQQLRTLKRYTNFLKNNEYFTFSSILKKRVGYL